MISRLIIFTGTCNAYADHATLIAAFVSMPVTQAKYYVASFPFRRLSEPECGRSFPVIQEARSESYLP